MIIIARKYKQIHRKELTFDTKDWEKIERRAEACHTDTTKYLRRMILDREPIFYDMKDVAPMINGMRTISRNINQIAKKCSTYSKDQNECSAHFIRTCVLKELLLNEINKLLEYVSINKENYLDMLTKQTIENHLEEVKQAKKTIAKSEKRIAELDKLFTWLYEDNISGKISDERFEMMSRNYENEQKQLKASVTELQEFVETKEH